MDSRENCCNIHGLSCTLSQARLLGATATQPWVRISVATSADFRSSRLAAKMLLVPKSEIVLISRPGFHF